MPPFSSLVLASLPFLTSVQSWSALRLASVPSYYDRGRPFYPTYGGSTRRFASTTLISSSTTDGSPPLNLADQIQQAYENQETDGILGLARDNGEIILDTDPQSLIQATIQGTRPLAKPRAAAAGVWNAWMGACNLLEAAEQAQELWTAMEDQKGEESYISPDIVTYSLVYQATRNHDSTFADKILQEALQVSKKQAGSKRRKALAAARRRKSTENADTQHMLRETLQDNDPSILQDADEYLIISKPSGVACYHTSTTTAGKLSGSKKKKSSNQKRDIGLEDALMHCGVPLSTLNPECLGLVHRLDRGTSGCIVLAKTEEMHTQLVTAFFLRQVQKQYTALVSPAPESEQNKVLVDVPVKGHAATSHVSILERFGSSAAVVQVEPKTGRQHQVRVHCAQGMNAPVVLDPLYATTTDWHFLPANLLETEETNNHKKTRRKQSAKGQSERFFLHASSLAIPSLGIQAQAPLPEWWCETMDTLRSSNE